jgi:hypothetical protein
MKKPNGELFKGYEKDDPDGWDGKLCFKARKLQKALKKEFAIDDVAGKAILEKLGQCENTINICEGRLAKEGLTITDKFGQLKPHPLAAILRDARAQFIACIKALNIDLEPLNPTSGRPFGR